MTNRSDLWPNVRTLFAFALVALATRLPMVGFPFINVDEAAHLVGAQELMGEGRIYQTFVDNKPPLIYFFYALGLGSMPALRALAILFIWLPLAWLAGSEVKSANHRLLAGCFYLVTSAGFVAADTHAVNTEMLGLVPLALATWLFFRAQDELTIFWVGCLLGLATLAKQPFLAFLLAPVVTLAAPWRGFRHFCLRIWPLILGVSCPLGATSLVFVALGSHDDYLRWVWAFNVQHVRSPVSFQDVLARIAKMILPLGAASAPLFVLAFSTRLRRPNETDSRPSPLQPRQRRTFLLVALGTAMVTGCLGFRFFGHYFIPAHYFLVQLASPAFTIALSSPGRSRLLGVLALVPGVVFSFLNPFLYSAHGGVAPVTKPVFEEVGNYIAESPCKGPIFVWGYAPQIYYFAHRTPATRYVVPIEPITEYISGNEEFERGPLPAGLHVSEPRRQELLADLERNRPSHIVDFSSTKLDHWDRFPLTTFEGLHRFVADNYVNLDRPQGSVTIFERRSCSTPHASPHSP